MSCPTHYSNVDDCAYFDTEQQLRQTLVESGISLDAARPSLVARFGGGLLEQCAQTLVDAADELAPDSLDA
ncbi:hypothetical protein [Actinosynnema mirum]|uniref:Uncharacterized protein n=1 Tax=Actinosynnema mirum (strain ATCC 29888 / DSM 43827 / JCM 3225 / NBRC 14064 / NCIMB 13271 / NRRL B-12336 / IMRU 3971 / 101) TaxID=446462 RepID=C6WBB6_ACTMD|nr:hypothetical protein [Actinosynnema mirum]ACU39407.1 hypothetical protein Amir_5589 [Actinosynnema mirum DSM 43827]